MSLNKPKVVVVMPAYNAAQTLRMTYAELPQDSVDLVIVVDDGSSDQTAAIARELVGFIWAALQLIDVSASA